MKPGRIFFSLFLLLSAWQFTFGQTAPPAGASPSGILSGTVTDDKGQALIGVNLVLTRSDSTAEKHYAVTDVNGAFQFPKIPQRAYQLQVTYVGFDALNQAVNLLQENQSLGKLQMLESARQLKEVQVVGKAPTAQQKGDTLQFNASAYKVNRDAQTEDLIKKMPGVTVQNGTVQVQGENVQQILVDGKPFFGDDPTIALRNLPAEVVDKIEVFDRLSDQSQFTGFNDGNTSKTINIVTRGDRRNGQFGRVYAGYGTNDTYQAGGSMNFFKGDRRLSVIGLSNNINQQNFSGQDLLGVQSAGGTRGGGGGGRGGGGGGGGARGGGNFGGGGASNFLVGNANGINTTHSVGLNYSDQWGKKLAVRGSYFFNQGNSRNEQSTVRDYFLNQETTQRYEETQTSGSRNNNHRVNFRFEYTIDRNNSLLITPNLSFQDNRSNSDVTSSTRQGDALQNTGSNSSSAQTYGYNMSNNILYRHRFAKMGRSLSVNLGMGLNDRDQKSFLLSNNTFYGANPDTTLIDQKTLNRSKGYQVSGNVSYTEPLSKKTQLQFSYNLSYRYSDADKRTYQNNPFTHLVQRLDTLLTNNFNNDYVTHQVGTGINYRGKKLGLFATVNLQDAELSGQKTFPQFTNIDRSFINLLPMVMLDYTLNQDNKLRLTYRTSTNAPSITQLQDVVDNSNPLQVSTGNPLLKQEYSHNVGLRYSLTKPTKAASFLTFINFGYTQNPIGTSTLIAQRPTTLANGYVLQQGVQLTQPVNYDNNMNFRTFVTGGLPLKTIKSQVNVNASFTYNRTPGLINRVLNLAHQYASSAGVVVSSNISEKLDFNLGYNASYNQQQNTVQTQSNSNYTVQTANARLNWIFGKGFVYRTDFSYYSYSGLAAGFNQQFSLWNMEVGKKFLKNQAGELKISVFDLLNQNTSITRTLTETYREDVRSLVLKQYFMLTFTYTLRNFKSGSMPTQDNQEQRPWRERGGMGPGMGPGGMGPRGGF